jgi:hypothetical protein
VTNETESFVNEVDESLRQDRALTMAKRYGPWLIGVFILLMAALGAWQWWQGEQEKRSRAQSDAYMAAIELAQAGNFDAAKTEFDRLSGEGPRAYRVMSKMQSAAILQGQGDLDGAIAAFDEAADLANDPLMRDTARLRAAYIAAETQDFAAVQARLQPIIDADTRLSYLARELLGVEAWEAGELDLARSTLENLTLAFEAPQGVQQRAQLALSVIGPAPAASGAETAPSQGEN